MVHPKVIRSFVTPRDNGILGMSTSKYATPNTPSPPCNIPVICIDDRNRPQDVPASLWPVKGNPYTIIGFHKMLRYGVIGVSLAEMDITACHPYKYYLESRFAPADALKSLHEEADRLLQQGKEEYEREFEQETV